MNATPNDFKRAAVKRMKKPPMQSVNYITPETNAIYCIDALELAKQMPPESVQCIVTSPPYFGLRDYGITGQIGLEQTPQVYIQRLVELFRELRRVLKKDGVLWLNLGDSYSGSNGNGWKQTKDKNNRSNDGDANISLRKMAGRRDTWRSNNAQNSSLQGGKTTMLQTNRNGVLNGDLPAKNLLLIPHRVAMALQADGWILRSDIIWSKPNPMPESVKDRPTKAHEYIFLLTKNARYYYDADAVREPVQEQTVERYRYGWDGNEQRGYVDGKQNNMRSYMTNVGQKQETVEAGRNLRSVWTITPKPYSEAHFATFPPEIPELCIKAGSRKGDVIYDPFMGAGTTALVARNLGRTYIGSELNPEYVKLAKDRLRLPFEERHIEVKSEPIEGLPLFVTLTESA